MSGRPPPLSAQAPPLSAQVNRQVKTGEAAIGRLTVLSPVHSPVLAKRVEHHIFQLSRHRLLRKFREDHFACVCLDHAGNRDTDFFI